MTELVELVDGDQHRFVLVWRKPEQLERAGQKPSVIDPDAASLKPQRIECRRGRRDQLNLCHRSSLADDVDIALHELTKAPLLWAFGPPDWRDLDGPESGRELSSVACVKPRERNSQIESQPKVGEINRIRGRRQVVSRESTLHHGERKLLIIAAQPRMQAVAVFHHRSLDLVEAVCAIGIANHCQNAVAPGFLSRKKIAHSARRGHG